MKQIILGAGVADGIELAKDIVVGYSYLIGGVGGSVFRDFRLLTDYEVKTAVLN